MDAPRLRSNPAAAGPERALRKEVTALAGHRKSAWSSFHGAGIFSETWTTAAEEETVDERVKALMSVAKTVTDAYLLYLSPRSKDYRLFVRTTTPDFAPDSDAEAQSLADTLAGKRRKMERRLAKHVAQSHSVQTGTAPLMATVPEGQSI